MHRIASSLSSYIANKSVTTMPMVCRPHHILVLSSTLYKENHFHILALTPSANDFMERCLRHPNHIFRYAGSATHFFLQNPAYKQYISAVRLCPGTASLPDFTLNVRITVIPTKYKIFYSCLRLQDFIYTP